MVPVPLVDRRHTLMRRREPFIAPQPVDSPAVVGYSKKLNSKFYDLALLVVEESAPGSKETEVGRSAAKLMARRMARAARASIEWMREEHGRRRAALAKEVGRA